MQQQLNAQSVAWWVLTTQASYADACKFVQSVEAYAADFSDDEDMQVHAVAALLKRELQQLHRDQFFYDTPDVETPSDYAAQLSALLGCTV